MSEKSPNLDHIITTIRAEARARGAKGRIGLYTAEPSSSGASPATKYGLSWLEIQHVSDLLVLPLDEFIAQAYRCVLVREADPGGLVHFQRSLLRGRLTRAEMLGRLSFSPEGRMRNKRVSGLRLAFLAATFYRIPVFGPLGTIVARLLRLPAHLQNRAEIEAIALATGYWLKR